MLIGAAVSAVATSLTGADVDAGVLGGAEMSSGGAVLFKESASFASPSTLLVSFG
jgi:hypothetical protein